MSGVCCKRRSFLKASRKSLSGRLKKRDYMTGSNFAWMGLFNFKEMFDFMDNSDDSKPPHFRSVMFDHKGMQSSCFSCFRFRVNSRQTPQIVQTASSNRDLEGTSKATHKIPSRKLLHEKLMGFQIKSENLSPRLKLTLQMISESPSLKL